MSRESEELAWRSLAACQGTDPELFFPPGRDDRATAQIAAAKAICASCPVVTECLEFALRHRVRDGIWGGRTDRERQGLRRASSGARLGDAGRPQ